MDDFDKDFNDTFKQVKRVQSVALVGVILSWLVGCGILSGIGYVVYRVLSFCGIL